ncbi:PAS domain-containing methyl-accepting chemotaxis protein [Vibrio tritonius]|uniref:methyl-accepting chemotaxis protein n=1 Tax=Vibrio tritonius TaxID=1435069 RepID=UPI00315CE3CD
MDNTNQNIIDEEVSFPQDMELVSTTDIRGHITYANEEFCKVAGFTLEELLHKNHNIVRHPSMPKEAFQDLWDHLKEEQNWRGAVKNRCKDGRYYWVDAFVTPIYEHGELVGYQSVRRNLTPEIRKRAEIAYDKMLNGRRALPLFDFKASTKLTLSFVASLIVIVGTIFISPYLSMLLPLVYCMLFYSDVVTNSRYNEELSGIYDSISRYIYCDYPKNNAEFHIRMQKGKVKTIVGRTLDSGRDLLTKVKQMQQLSKSSQNNIEVQTEELEKISTAVEEMVATIHEVARNSSQTSDQVRNASQLCQTAMQNIQSTETKVMDLSDEVNNSAAATDLLAEKIEQIDSVMNEIQGVAEQTNLLALNAAIEAARAGEQGRGFAVVADEVRALSQRTHKATEGIQSSMKDVVATLSTLKSTMQAGEKAAQSCVEDTSNTKASVSDLTEAVRIIDDAATQISTAAEQQSVVAKEINENLTTIKDASGRNLNDANGVFELANDVQLKADQLANLGMSFKA